MIRAQAGGLLAFGFSDLDLEVLKAGNPIYINLTQMGGMPVRKVLFFYGKTEADMTTDLVTLGYVMSSDTMGNA